MTSDPLSFLLTVVPEDQILQHPALREAAAAAGDANLPSASVGMVTRYADAIRAADVPQAVKDRLLDGVAPLLAEAERRAREAAQADVERVAAYERERARRRAAYRCSSDQDVERLIAVAGNKHGFVQIDGDIADAIERSNGNVPAVSYLIKEMEKAGAHASPIGVWVGDGERVAHLRRVWSRLTGKLRGGWSGEIMAEVALSTGA